MDPSADASDLLPVGSAQPAPIMRPNLKLVGNAPQKSPFRVSHSPVGFRGSPLALPPSSGHERSTPSSTVDAVHGVRQFYSTNAEATAVVKHDSVEHCEEEEADVDDDVEVDEETDDELLSAGGAGGRALPIKIKAKLKHQGRRTVLFALCVLAVFENVACVTNFSLSLHTFSSSLTLFSHHVCVFTSIFFSHSRAGNIYRQRSSQRTRFLAVYHNLKWASSLLQVHSPRCWGPPWSAVCLATLVASGTSSCWAWSRKLSHILAWPSWILCSCVPFFL